MSDAAEARFPADPTEPSGPTTARRPANRRELILEAAIGLFHERGYHATGVDDIGQAVDLSGPAIYRHFASKEEILLEAIRMAGDELHAANSEARAAESDPGRLMELFVRAFARVAIERAALMTVWISEVRHLTPSRRSPVTRRIRAWTTEWAQVLTDWRPELDTETARLLVAGAIGLTTTVATTGAPDPELLEDHIATMALAVLGTPIGSQVQEPPTRSQNADRS